MGLPWNPCENLACSSDHQKRKRVYLENPENPHDSNEKKTLPACLITRKGNGFTLKTLRIHMTLMRQRTMPALLITRKGNRFTLKTQRIHMTLMRRRPCLLVQSQEKETVYLENLENPHDSNEKKNLAWSRSFKHGWARLADFVPARQAT
jgi:hypothetical protein